MKKEKFDITGMTCSACVSHIEKAMGKLEGVQSLNVNLLNNNMQVEYDENKLTSDEIVQTVRNGGYGASLHNESPSNAPKSSLHNETKQMKTRLWVSVVFMLPLFYISMGHMMGLPLPAFLLGHENAMSFAFIQFLLCLPILYVNFKYFINGFKSLFRGAPNMDSLIAIGTSAAMIYGIYAMFKISYGLGHGNMETVHAFSMDLYFESAAMILTLITLGKFLEARAKGKTSDAISKLMDLAPKTALVLRDGQEIEIPAEEVLINDTIIIKPGQSIPVDGIIIEGNSAIDESAITGESIPVEKTINSKVTSGTINKNGFFKMTATKIGGDTTLAKIIQLVEEASSSKAPIAKLADKVSSVFVPTVIAIAFIASGIWLLLGYSFEFAISIGIAVLVISCPCALGLATPTAIMVATGKGAQNGILIKSAESLEILHHIDTVVLDKTGTITEGKPKVTDILCFQEINQEELLTIAASLESVSEHPLAEAILSKATEENIIPKSITDFQSITGQGISAKIDGISYWAGNEKLLSSQEISLKEQNIVAADLAEAGKTPLFFANQSGLIGIIAVMDTIKPTSEQALKEWRDMGIETIILTGDNQRTAKAIQRLVKADNVIAEVMPVDKEQHIRTLMEKGKHVCMIGDGINDSPALARADVGIAIGAGTDIAIESADVVLMKSDLLDAVSAIQLSKATIRNIKQNLFWALFYNAAGIPLAAGLFYGILQWKLNPMFAAAAMSLSSVCVVANALRLKTFHPHFKHRSKGNNNSFENIISVKNTNTSAIEKGDFTMKKIMKIEGMSCGHCSSRVESVLNAIEGVSAIVNLTEKQAEISLTKEVSDDTLKNAVINAGYEVITIN